jgi:hypothetical protein
LISRQFPLILCLFSSTSRQFLLISLQFLSFFSISLQKCLLEVFRVKLRNYQENQTNIMEMMLWAFEFSNVKRFLCFPFLTWKQPIWDS